MMASGDQEFFLPPPGMLPFGQILSSWIHILIFVQLFDLQWIYFAIRKSMQILDLQLPRNTETLRSSAPKEWKLVALAHKLVLAATRRPRKHFTSVIIPPTWKNLKQSEFSPYIHYLEWFITQFLSLTKTHRVFPSATLGILPLWRVALTVLLEGRGSPDGSRSQQWLRNSQIRHSFVKD